MLETVFILLVGILLLLACIDLFVGVSNDAVNFLNSAVGCRIASLQVILIVASLGVLFGSTFSSGMMSLARNGMFHPDLFSFYDVIVIFMAVVVTDILLMNIFNSLGLPTSTTVSIVFELLGAAVCVAAYKLSGDEHSILEIVDYIKSDKAMTIVSAILISVVVAFFSGAVVQFVLRVLFTFKIQNTYKYLGGVFAGVSLTAIFYFLVMKGAKGASFMKPEYIQFINDHTSTILWILFIGLSVLGQILVLLKINIFRVIILSGTFALAFSFAGNDLVNFIGVSLAALDALLFWMESGSPDPHSFMMLSLNNTDQASTFYLVLAGLLMVFTLWVSKKAHHVIQTSINLSSSSRGEHEQFGASMPGRMVTRFGLGLSRTTISIMPQFMLAFFAVRYQKAPVVKGEIPLPFDYVRASVNLVLASILIASATSLKLPLSTTYVTFMVAMGTSFADGAWDRESAVYRISGVITVIAGWFLTGMSAFIAAAVVSVVFLYLGYFALFTLSILAMFLVIRSNFSKSDTPETIKEVIEAKGDNHKIFESITKAVPGYFDAELNVVDRALEHFFNDDEIKLRRACNKASNIEDEISRERSGYYTLALSRPSQSEHGVTIDAKHFFYLAFSTMREASKSIHFMMENAVTHVANRHTIFTGPMKDSLLELKNKLHTISNDVHAVSQSPTSENVEALVKHAKKLNRDIDRAQVNLVGIIGSQHVSMHSAEMYLGFLQAFRDLANRYVAVAMQSRALSQIVSGQHVDNNVANAQLKTQVLGSSARTSEGEAIITQAVDTPDANDIAETKEIQKQKADLEAALVAQQAKEDALTTKDESKIAEEVKSDLAVANEANESSDSKLSATDNATTKQCLSLTK